MSTSPPQSGMPVRASQILRDRRIWVLPVVIAAVFVALMSAIYFGSVVNPTGHLHDLPVIVVNEDGGATVHGQKVELGTGLVRALEGSRGVTTRLKLTNATIGQADAAMDRGAAYATLVIPATFSRSALLAAGAGTAKDAGSPKGAGVVAGPAAATSAGVVTGAAAATSAGAAVPARATVDLLENARLGTLAVNLVAGVMTPAIERISPQIGTKIAPLAAAPAAANPVTAALVADPVALATSSYRPLPDHSALGLSAFYVALLAIMSGFVAATLINSSIDSALGYGATDVGPRWQHRRPVAIGRRQTLLVKWVAAGAAAPVLTGILLLVSAGLLKMHAPHLLLLWLVMALASLMIAIGTLTLLATFGAIGQLVAMVFLVYLSLASSGGTVPTQALPGFFDVVGHVEPLRQVLDGTRAVLYFGARGDAGLTHSLILIVAELAFWALVGLAVTSWYDRKGLYRLSPDRFARVSRAIDGATRDAQGEVA
jgi:YhgE/Pip-like protein